MLQAVRQHGHALQFAAEELRGNHEVVLEAVRQDGYALQLSSEELRGDRESFLDRVREKGFVLRNTSDDLKRDREIVLKAVTPSVLQEGPHAAIAEYNAEASTPSGGNKRGEPLRFVLASHVALDQVLHPFACMRSVLELRCDLVVRVAEAQVRDGAPLPCPSRRFAGTLRRVQLSAPDAQRLHQIAQQLSVNWVRPQ